MYKFKTPEVEEEVYTLAEQVIALPLEDAHEVESKSYIASYTDNPQYIRLARKCLPFQEWATNGKVSVFKFRSAHIVTSNFVEFYYIVKKLTPKEERLEAFEEIPIVEG